MDFEIQLPEEITNLMNGGGLPSPEMMNFYVDEKDRIFFIDFECIFVFYITTSL